MRYTHIRMSGAVLFKINIIKTPVMREMRAYQDNIARLEPFNAVANELRAFTFLEMYELHFRMVMPAVINMRNNILPHAERMPRAFGYFE
jgi:hypothetical protein